MQIIRNLTKICSISFVLLNIFVDVTFAQNAESYWKPWFTIRYDSGGTDFGNSTQGNIQELDHKQSGYEFEFSFGLALGLYESEFAFKSEKSETVLADCIVYILCNTLKDRKTNIDFQSTIKMASIGYNLTNYARTRFLSFGYMQSYDSEGKGTAKEIDTETKLFSFSQQSTEQQYEVKPGVTFGTYFRAGLVFGERFLVSMKIVYQIINVQYNDNITNVVTFLLGFGAGIAI